MSVSETNLELDCSNTVLNTIENENTSVNLSEEGEIEEAITEEAIFEIKFRNNNDFSNLCHTVIRILDKDLNFMFEKYKFLMSEDEQNIKVFLVNPLTELTPIDSTAPLDPQEQNDLFKIDTTPTGDLNKAQVPSYKRTIKDTLAESSESKKRKNDADKCQRPSRSTTECFNCGTAGHEIRACPKPRNTFRINRAKKLFTHKQERYHVDIEQRFAHLHPGVVSKQLQTALDLRRGELPFFFYRMRLLGYPPGWLEDAKVAQSGISLFNSDGMKELQPDAENASDDDAEVIKYDFHKIIDFPGFNLHPGETFYDDHNHHNVPPINPQHMKQEFVNMLGMNKFIIGYKRKKLKNPTLADVQIKSENTNTTKISDEMEIADDNEFENEAESRSPTLADLEDQHQVLLMQLNSDTVVNKEPKASSVIKDNDIILETTQDDVEQNADQSCESPTSPLPSSSNQIKLSHVGTPILKFSPYEKLPDGDNFKVGVSDVINFENLPDSTGKYDQLKVVIKKVRNIVTQMQSEDC